ncbi:bifunctional 2-polyprenyl-6-hydroxyphenol methylase/3-demethylubiquinol 3-O-methyltransferase UbiG [Streptomyces sp. DH12]|uniref:class I SAM-dependent methyltransferase n=1 Tax=Streptomyces sp. DH12 TaxID=2857010 RepID=UPI001E565DFC|nr:class I SAM-dependent methyltransferase [Streptomyces sp. DH12]
MGADTTVEVTAADWDEHYLRQQPRLITEQEAMRFRRRVRPRAGWRAIDLGCGPGRWTRQLNRWGLKVTGYDYSRRAISQALRRGVATPYGRGIDFRLWDIARDPCPGELTAGSIDLITCRASLAYLEPAVLLDKVGPLLAPGGVFYALIPLRPSYLDGPFYRGMTPDEVDRLAGEGWTGRSDYRLGHGHRGLVLHRPHDS